VPPPQIWRQIDTYVELRIACVEGSELSVSAMA